MKNLIPAITALLASVALGAQNLNPTVTVTNDYEARAAAVDKKGVDLEIPDTLMRFDYKFDYSVFDSPYKGAYEFSPYSVKMIPSPEPYQGGKLYLRAGAGYTMRPELDVVWAPVVSDNFAMSVFGTADGYLGPYKLSATDPTLFDATDKWLHNFSDNAGVDLHWNLSGSNLTVEIAHDGIFADTRDAASTAYNSAYVRANLKSNASSGTYFVYDLNLKYRFGHDGFGNASGCNSMTEHNILASGSVGSVVHTDYRFMMDFEVEADSFAGDCSGTLMRVGATPHILFTLGPVALSAGVELGYSDAFRIYPDIKAEYTFMDGLMTAYGDFVGGERINSWHSSKVFMHRLISNSVSGDAVTFGRDLYDARLGLRGYYNYLQYDISAGFGKVENLASENLVSSLYGASEQLVWADARVLHADASVSWKNRDFEADANIRLCHDMAVEPCAAYARPLVSADARFVYNWSRRIYAGLWLAGRTERASMYSSNQPSIPGWFDLGLYGKYRLSHKWSVWAQAGNILGSDIRESIGYVRQGPYFTVGIGLNL